MIEEWRPVYDYEQLYVISNLGRLKRVKQARGGAAGLILKSSTVSGCIA